MRIRRASSWRSECERRLGRRITARKAERGRYGNQVERPQVGARRLLSLADLQLARPIARKQIGTCGQYRASDGELSAVEEQRERVGPAIAAAVGTIV